MPRLAERASSPSEMDPSLPGADCAVGVHQQTSVSVAATVVAAAAPEVAVEVAAAVSDNAAAAAAPGAGAEVAAVVGTAYGADAAVVVASGAKFLETRTCGTWAAALAEGDFAPSVEKAEGTGHPAVCVAGCRCVYAGCHWLTSGCGEAVG